MKKKNMLSYLYWPIIYKMKLDEILIESLNTHNNLHLCQQSLHSCEYYELEQTHISIVKFHDMWTLVYMHMKKTYCCKKIVSSMCLCDMQSSPIKCYQFQKEFCEFI